MKSYTAQAMREPDRRTIAEGFASGIELMEQAGYGLFRAVMRFADSIFMPDFLLLAGKGNNGGDVFVLARYMAEAHVRFRLCMSCAPDELSGDALEAFRRMPAGTFGKKTADGLQVRKIVAGGIFTPQKNVAESIIHLAFRYGLLRIAHIGGEKEFYSVRQFNIISAGSDRGLTRFAVITGSGCDFYAVQFNRFIIGKKQGVGGGAAAAFEKIRSEPF